MKLELIKIISSFNGKKLFLPNSVDLFKNGDIVICDGGNDRLCKYDEKFHEINQFGKRGWFFNRFKEPVGAFVVNESIYVMDWHNHRVVVLNKDLKFFTEFGYFEKFDSKKNSRFKKVIVLFIGILRRIPLNGAYIDYHFTERKIFANKYLRIDQIIISFMGFIYSMIVNFLSGDFTRRGFNKPNGIAQIDDVIVISQKKNRCLSVHEKTKPYKRVKNVFNDSITDEFGNLGNVTTIGEKIYVCDESNGKVKIYNKDLLKVDEICGKRIGIAKFQPFSCCAVVEDIFAVISIDKLILFDVNENKTLVHKTLNNSELHGVAFDRQTNQLFLCDRANSNVKVFLLRF